MKRLGVGVLGVGEMGLRHAENLASRVPHARLVAVADANLERARKVAKKLGTDRAYPGLDEMLGSEDVDAVVIATPDKFHASAVRCAAQAGKDIFCEKPLALSLTDAHNLLEAVESAGVRLQVGFMRRYDPAYASAMKRIEAGEIGTPVVFKSVGRDKEPPPLSAYQSGLNGTLFYTNTIHDFDLARWLMCDEVSEVHSFTTSLGRPEVTEFGDVVAGIVNLKFYGHAIGNIESHAQAMYGYDVRTEIVGSTGSIFIGSLTQNRVTSLSAQGSTRMVADHFLSTFAEAYEAEMRDFVDCMLEDRMPSVSGADGLRALAIAVAADESRLRGNPVKVLSGTPVAAP